MGKLVRNVKFKKNKVEIFDIFPHPYIFSHFIIQSENNFHCKTLIYQLISTIYSVFSFTYKILITINMKQKLKAQKLRTRIFFITKDKFFLQLKKKVINKGRLTVAAQHFTRWILVFVSDEGELETPMLMNFSRKFVPPATISASNFPSISTFLAGKFWFYWIAGYCSCDKVARPYPLYGLCRDDFHSPLKIPLRVEMKLADLRRQRSRSSFVVDFDSAGHNTACYPIPLVFETKDAWFFAMYRSAHKTQMTIES